MCWRAAPNHDHRPTIGYPGARPSMGLGKQENGRPQTGRSPTAARSAALGCSASFRAFDLNLILETLFSRHAARTNQSRLVLHRGSDLSAIAAPGRLRF